jgi:hypothetical protein
MKREKNSRENGEREEREEEGGEETDLKAAEVRVQVPAPRVEPFLQKPGAKRRGERVRKNEERRRIDPK